MRKIFTVEAIPTPTKCALLWQKWNAPSIAKGQANSLKSRPARQRADEEVLIELKDVWKTFGDKTVLQGANIKIRRGEAVGIIGGSGTGKSTTLRLMAGLLMPDQVGSLHIHSKGFFAMDFLGQCSSMLMNPDRQKLLLLLTC